MIVDEYTGKPWAEFRDNLVEQLKDKTSEFWLYGVPNMTWIIMVATEIAQYRHELSIATTESRKKEIEITLKFVVSQVDAKIEELRMNIKQGLLETFKATVISVLQFFIKMYFPFEAPPVVSEVVGSYLAHKMDVEEENTVTGKDIIVNTELQVFKDTVKAQIKTLKTQEFTYPTLAATILGIIAKALPLVTSVFNMNEVNQREYLQVAVGELLEEVDLPLVEGKTEEFLKAQLVKGVPIALDWIT
jgi:hypothetical protein